MTGLWDAHVDHAPALALTGQVQTQVLGRGAFQEIPLAKAFAEVARFSHAVLHASNHVELMNLACKHALLEQNVAHLIFPDEVQNLPAAAETKPGTPAGRMPRLDISPDPRSFAEAEQQLRAAKRPVIIVGYGAREDMAAITSLAERLNAPVITTFKAKGQISDHHPLGCGVLGRSGTPIASWFMNECDLLVVFGASFSNHTGISAKHPIVQVDWDRAALGRFHPVTVPGLGRDRRPTVDGLARSINSAPPQRSTSRTRSPSAGPSGAPRRTAAPATTAATASARPPSSPPSPARSRTTRSWRSTSATTPTPSAATSSASARLLMSGYLGSIGFGLPAAMGAWAATREQDPAFRGRKVVSVSGDGGFGQYMAELTTLVKYGMNITHVLLDNRELGKISKEQRGGQWPVWETSLQNPDFARFARNCGAYGVRIERAADLDESLRDALADPRPALLEIVADVELV